MFDVVQRARELATAAHRGQKDKIGEDYIHHPAAVVALLTTVPGFADLSPQDRDGALAAAWLHDVLEDTPLTAEDLQEEGFSPEVIAAVNALTHQQTEPRREYYERVVAHRLARLVKIADVAHNSSLNRMRWLDPVTRHRLEDKYRAAAEVLLRSSDEREWFSRATAIAHGPR